MEEPRDASGRNVLETEGAGFCDEVIRENAGNKGRRGNRRKETQVCRAKARKGVLETDHLLTTDHGHCVSVSRGSPSPLRCEERGGCWSPLPR